MSAVASPVLDTPRPMTSAQLDQLAHAVLVEYRSAVDYTNARHAVAN